MLRLAPDDRLYLSTTSPVGYTLSGILNEEEGIITEGLVTDTQFITDGNADIEFMSVTNNSGIADVTLFVNGIDPENTIFEARLHANFSLIFNAEGFTVYNGFGLPVSNPSSGTLSDGDYGDITVSGTGTIMTVDNGLPATRIADGSVSNTEFQYINSLTSNVQDQLDALSGGVTLEEVIAMAIALG